MRVDVVSERRRFEIKHVEPAEGSRPFGAREKVSKNSGVGEVARGCMYTCHVGVKVGFGNVGGFGVIAKVAGVEARSSKEGGRKGREVESGVVSVRVEV